MEQESSDDYKVLQVGVGIMGRNHANTITALSDKAPVYLSGVCDSDLEKLISFKEDYPDIPVYLVYGPQYQTREEYEEMKEQAIALGIPAVETVADAVDELDVNSLMNCTNNDSHIPVLESALSVKENNQTKIRMVFQEKPFAHTLEEAEEFVEKIKNENVSFSLNSILEYSHIWKDLFEFISDYPGQLTLKKVITSYGKDRTQDSRPATGGWVGLEGIHAVDISTALIKNLEIEEDETASTYGFLAKEASKDGQVSFGISSKIKGQNRNNADEVSVEIEGSFAWKDQVRRTIYIFEDTENNKLIASQLLFDKPEKNSRCDELKIFECDEITNTRKEIHRSQSYFDKLQNYYLCSVDPAQQSRIYDIKRSIDVQKVLEALSRPAKVFNIAAAKSAAAPQVMDLEDLSVQQIGALKSKGIKGLQIAARPKKAPPKFTRS